MANAQVNLSFLENGRGGLYMYLFSCWIQVFCSNTTQSTNLLHNIYYILCSLCFHNYFVVMILVNGMIIWIKIILLSNKMSSTWRKNISSIYMYLQWKKQKIYIYQCNKFLTQVAVYKVLLPMLFVKKKTDYRSHLINFLCSSPVHHSHLAKTIYL